MITDPDCPRCQHNLKAYQSAVRAGTDLVKEYGSPLPKEYRTMLDRIIQDMEAAVKARSRHLRASHQRRFYLGEGF